MFHDFLPCFELNANFTPIGQRQTTELMADVDKILKKGVQATEISARKNINIFKK